jgi:hypothetical protein
MVGELLAVPLTKHADLLQDGRRGWTPSVEESIAKGGHPEEAAQALI